MTTTEYIEQLLGRSLVVVTNPEKPEHINVIDYHDKSQPIVYYEVTEAEATLLCSGKLPPNGHNRLTYLDVNNPNSKPVCGYSAHGTMSAYLLRLSRCHSGDWHLRIVK